MRETQQAFWDLASELRGQHINKPLDIIKEAQKRGLILQVDDLRWVFSRFPSRSYGVLPAFISRFILAYLNDTTASSLLDVWAGFGEISIPLCKKIRPAQAMAFERNREKMTIAKQLESADLLEWIHTDPFDQVLDINQTFDLIVGAPPFAYGFPKSYGKPTPFKVLANGTIVEGRDTRHQQLIMQASLLLEPDGIGFFVTSPSFLLRDRKGSVYSRFPALGLSLEAALSLPSGTFSPQTTLDGLLLIVRKQPQRNLLMGDLTDDESAIRAIVKNLREQSDSKVPQLGRWVKPYEYASLDELVLHLEVEELARQQSFPPIAIPDFSAATNLSRRNHEEPFKDLPNSVYLPLIGASPAVASLSELQIKPQNYVQLICDTEKVLAQYLAEFFNSPLGLKIRQLHSGGFIPKLSKARIRNLTVYLPELELQIAAVRVHSKLELLEAKISDLNDQLWQDPAQSSQIERQIPDVEKIANIEDWIKTLPFPLASILWTYHAESRPADKVGHLFHFFEALSQFHTTIMLSAYAEDEEFYRRESRNWLSTEPEYRGWYKRPSFGNWNNLGARLAKSTRRFLHNDEVKDQCLQLFRRPEEQFLTMLSNRKIINVLNEVLAYRNNWKGHGGIAGSREHERRLSLLEIHLNTVRKVISNAYSSVMVIAPETSDYANNIFNYQAKLIMGNNFPFKKINVQTTIPLDSQYLFFVPRNQYRPLKLLPLFRLMESPQTQQNACYFYNRVEGKQIRWVSYHFENEAEITMPDPSFDQVFELFEPTNT